MAKTKRYADGGMEDSGDFYEAGSGPVMGEDTGMSEKEPETLKPSTFKEAFAAARKAGDKTFMFGGKKFTTEMAGEKKAVPAASKAEAPKAKSSYETPYDRMNRQNRESSAAKREAEKEVANLRSRHPAPGRGRIDTSNINPKTLLPNKMAKGGMTASKRADGIAQKGKTRCKTY